MALKSHLLDLAGSGCVGTAQDFLCWVRGKEAGLTVDHIRMALEKLTTEDVFQKRIDSSGDYFLGKHVMFPESIVFNVASKMEGSPIQLVRSRVDSFLKANQVVPEHITDILIGLTEAMENAIKYSDDRDILVEYTLEASTFHVKITNGIKQGTPEDDIRNGKYTGGMTLMRGMLVMGNVFDNINLEISGETTAIFSGEKKVRKK